MKEERKRIKRPKNKFTPTAESIRKYEQSSTAVEHFRDRRWNWQKNWSSLAPIAIFITSGDKKPSSTDEPNPTLQPPAKSSKASTSEKVGFFEQVLGRSRAKKSAKKSEKSKKSSSGSSRVENAYHGKRKATHKHIKCSDKIMEV